VPIVWGYHNLVIIGESIKNKINFMTYHHVKNLLGKKVKDMDPFGNYIEFLEIYANPQLPILIWYDYNKKKPNGFFYWNYEYDNK